MDYMQVKKEEFSRLRPNIKWKFFSSLEEQNLHFADYMIQSIVNANLRGKKLVVVLPTGPIDYRPFVDRVNADKVLLKNLHVFMMDEYCKDEKTLVDEDHPLSFRRFIRTTLMDAVDPKLRLPDGNLLFPDPANPGCFDARIEELGGVDVVFGGFGVTGHLAFNDPPDEESECTVENVRDSATRVLRISRETITQNAIGGTRGLLELVPPLAVTIGMKPMLSARKIHQDLLRKWHSGVFRKCLFGPVTPKVPGSFLQQHSNVTVHMPDYVAQLPEVIVTLDV